MNHSAAEAEDNSSQPSWVVSVVHGDNSDLISHITPLYLQDGSEVADVTWGQGVFWKKVDTTRFTLYRSDLHPVDEELVAKIDFRNLPYADNSIDLVVLDPPYIHNSGKNRHISDDRYQNRSTTAGMPHKDIHQLYLGGMTEAWRVIRPGGQLWVKGKDQVEGGVQRWASRELPAAAEELGFYHRDQLLLIPPSGMPKARWINQLHARKIHSFLLVFDKPDPKTKRGGKKVAQVTTEPQPQPQVVEPDNPFLIHAARARAQRGLS